MTIDELRELLRSVKDPELPVIDIVELGIVRTIRDSARGVEIDITPTYSGCPAMEIIRQDIRELFAKHGIPLAEIHTVLSPAWTTDWISEDTKQKLRENNIAPPRGNLGLDNLVQLPTINHEEQIPCPRCSSLSTREESRFGSTACKALYFCNECAQPFEYMKTF